MTDSDLRIIENSLLSADKAFGLLTSMGYYNAASDEDVDDYLLCTVLIFKNKKSHNGNSVAVGSSFWLTKDKEICFSTNDLVKVFDVFKKCKRELICDLYRDVNTFDMKAYVERIKKLDTI